VLGVGVLALGVEVLALCTDVLVLGVDVLVLGVDVSQTRKLHHSFRYCAVLEFLNVTMNFTIIIEMVIQISSSSTVL
jgi:hypothetical protein